jgi:hypothetical protein
VPDFRKCAVLRFAIVCGLVLLSTRSNAQWWALHGPSDFEECAESAERTAATKETRASLLSECEAKFAGRRKPGGGYTYYDFMQNRHFDIAGPNPTQEEQKHIDEQYAEFLDHQRQGIIAAAFTERQKQQTETEIAKEKPLAPSAVAVPLPVSRPRNSSKTAECQDYLFSCGWSGFTAKIQNFKKTLLGPTKKTNRG